MPQLWKYPGWGSGRGRKQTNNKNTNGFESLRENPNCYFISAHSRKYNNNWCIKKSDSGIRICGETWHFPVVMTTPMPPLSSQAPSGAVPWQLTLVSWHKDLEMAEDLPVLSIEMACKCREDTWSPGKPSPGFYRDAIPRPAWPKIRLCSGRMVRREDFWNAGVNWGISDRKICFFIVCLPNGTTNNEVYFSLKRWD